MKRFAGLTILTAFLALWTIAAFAAVPQLINFQGILRDGSGNPVANGSYSVVFTIYDAASGGTNLWTETQSVSTSVGLFTAQLGAANPLPDLVFNNPNRWLGIKVGADPEMAPRPQLVSVGYAQRVGTVDGAAGGVISGDVSIQSNLSVDGALAGKNMLLVNPGPSQTPLSIQGSAGQTANLMEIKDDLGTPLVTVNASGTWQNKILVLDNAGAAETPLTIQSSSGQTANLMEIKDDLGAILGSVDSKGKLFHRYGIFAHSVSCGETLSVDQLVATPAIQLKSFSPTDNTISNFPNPVPIRIETSKGSMYIGRNDGVLQQISMDPAASVSKLTEWKNGAGATVASIEPSGATTIEHELGHNLGLCHVPVAGGFKFLECTNSVGNPVASIDASGNMSIDGDMDGLNSTWETGSFIDLNCSGTFNASGGAEIGGQDFIVSTGGSQFLNPVGIQTPPLPTFALDAAGSIHATSFPVSSDFRLKENVQPLTNVLEKLEKVRGVSFDWNETYEELGRSSGHREIGVIAQEVERVFPELVTKWGEKDYRAVDYGRMTAVLIEAVKEQQKQIEKLAKEIEKMKNQSRQAQVEN